MGRFAKLLLAHLRFVINRCVVRIQASDLVPRRARAEILRRWGVDCAPDAVVLSQCFFTSSNVTIGARAYLNHHIEIYAASDASIEIGAAVAIGPGSKLVALHHDIGTAERRAGRWYGKPVAVGDGCWLGSGVTVLPGVSIGRGCVVAAGAVVTRDCEPNGLYGGVPARRIRDLGV